MHLPVHELGRELARTLASLERSKDLALKVAARRADRAFYSSAPSPDLTGDLRELHLRLQGDAAERDGLLAFIAQLPTDSLSWEAMAWAYRDERLLIKQATLSK